MQPVHPCPPHWPYNVCAQVEVAVAALLVVVLDALDDVVVVVVALEVLEEVDVDSVVLLLVVVVVLDATDEEEDEEPLPLEEPTRHDLAMFHGENFPSQIDRVKGGKGDLYRPVRRHSSSESHSQCTRPKSTSPRLYQRSHPAAAPGHRGANPPRCCSCSH